MMCTVFDLLQSGIKYNASITNLSLRGLPMHTARAPNLRHDMITAKFSSVIPKQSDWSIMISSSGEGNININNFATLT